MLIKIKFSESFFLSTYCWLKLTIFQNTPSQPRPHRVDRAGHQEGRIARFAPSPAGPTGHVEVVLPQRDPPAGLQARRPAMETVHGLPRGGIAPSAGPRAVQSHSGAQGETEQPTRRRQGEEQQGGQGGAAEFRLCETERQRDERDHQRERQRADCSRWVQLQIFVIVWTTWKLFFTMCKSTYVSTLCCCCFLLFCLKNPDLQSVLPPYQNCWIKFVNKLSIGYQIKSWISSQIVKYDGKRDI